jgi:DNA invertase Pin-like site-specific DNA recombinase
MPDRALVYCRQSITKEEESLSLSFQERTCRDLARDRGWAVVEPIISDPDIKGWDTERPGIAELFRRIEPERIDIVIVYALSRFARDNILQETLWRNLHAKGVRLVSATEPHAEDDLVRGILGVVSQAERKRMGKFLSSSFQERALRGLPHGRTPFGYVKGEDGRLVVDDESAELVREMVTRIEQGASLWQLARELNASGAAGRRWEPNIVRNTVKSYAIVGAIKCGETIAWDTHEPIVPRDQWERVRALLASRPKTRAKPVSSWLEGLLDCGCGAPMHLVYNKHHEHRAGWYSQFRCSASPSRETFQRARSFPVCTHTPRSIVMPKAEQATRDALSAALSAALPPETVYAQQLARYDELSASSATEIRKLERQIARLTSERDRLLVVYRRGSLDVERWESEDRALGARIDVLARELAVFGAAPAREDYLAMAEVLRVSRIALEVDASQARNVLLRFRARVRLRSISIVRLVWPPEIAPFFDAIT